MSDPSSYRPRPGEIPLDPGVYRFSDAEGRVIYVGKAKSLRPRLSSYFQDISALHPRTRTMVLTATAVQWTVVANEVEALQLEYSWIKEFDPRFNVRYRDDKSYPYLAVTMSEEFPRALVMRGAKRRGTRYFGPYTHAWAIRETLDQLLRVFPVRTCSTGVFRRAAQAGRPCLLGYIGKCSAPCAERIGAQEHRILAEELCAFLDGHSDRFVRRIERQMRQAAAELDFELAARLRDQATALRTALEKSAVVLGDGTNADVFGLAGDELEVSVQLFHVRAGRIKGQRGWVAERQDENDGDLVEHLLTGVYGGDAGEPVPREILVPALPGSASALRGWLTGRRGGPVDLRVPQRGDKRALAQTVTRNAEQALARHKLSRAGDLTSRGQALAGLQEALGLAEAPLRIECFDISHTQGTNVVGSMVVFEDGLPRKPEYRRFIVRGESGEADQAGNDDTAAMREVLRRRFARRERERADAAGPSSGELPAAGSARRPGRFAYSPQLIVVDGGLPQVRAAQTALTEAGVSDVAVAGLAKRLEEVWTPDDDFPVVLPRSSDALFLLQRLRDEAHRFAITFHRKRRSRAMTRSVLDDVPGLGPARRKALLAAFGSVAAIRAAAPEELTTVSGIGPALAASIAATVSAAAPGAVDAATGEVS